MNKIEYTGGYHKIPYTPKQISVTMSPHGHPVITALCSDGSIWLYYIMDEVWQKLPTIEETAS